MDPIVRSHKTNNGTIRKRYHSVGEDQVCVKKQRIKKCVVCFKWNDGVLNRMICEEQCS